ncbi:MAG: EcoKI restriction-modification system protein HsdS [Candidatus Accumulibacter phosphatis]|jgi:type I restriction enzyme S subunit|uniref:EcoKI restriction-modification system protein HsdS n=1 Tax=Candidatus Accumulibacter phosphatis TaxID=327160 RepID=A0A084Y6I6_9PROT|nr:restriction endonuclease subunit S [Accumulibacter sp.]KFB70330.1 MAG: EcoKI restriction-modification system protein HsdS [Candidatus Accumulibacter phosphatis]HCZ13979.1 hypothetical protein [Accumulibacter sp.]HRF12904.1 restriction endonuclease subunit S [Candidatus Accumulibacter phosphatis]
MRIALIKDVTEFVLDGTHGSPVRAEVGVPVLSAQNVKDGRLNFETDRYTSDVEYDHFKKRLPLVMGDVLLTIVGTIGRAAVVDEIRPLVFQRSVAVIRPKQGALWPRFLYHVSQTREFQAQLARSSNQSSQAGLYLGKLKELRIPLPPLPEQRRIADILDKADALRAKRRAALAQLDTLTQSIFLNIHREAPKSQRVIPLAQIAEASRGAFVNGPFGSDLLTQELQDEGVPVIYIRDIRDGEYRRVSKSCVSERKAHDLAVCTVTAGDVLVAKVGDPPGIAAVYPAGNPPAVVTQDVIRIRVEREVASPEFVVGYLNSSIGKWKVAGITVEATRARFSLGEFKGLRIELPSVELQRDYARRIAAVNEIRAAHRASLAQLDALFASLQHRAFRGDL